MRLLRILQSAALLGGLAFLVPHTAAAQARGPFGGPAGCNTLAPGTSATCTLDTARGTRTFRLEVPQSVKPDNTMLVVDLHGFGDNNGGGEIRSSSFLTFARENGLIFALPAGLNASWNSQGQCCGQANAQNVDDVAFLKDLATKLAQIARLDRKNVIVTGLSNGGFMSDTLACEAADVFSASIPVSGGLSGGQGGGDAATIRRDCTPAMPIDVIEWHATADATVPFQTGILNSVGAVESRQIFAQVQSCDETPRVADQIGNVTCQVNPNCDGGIVSGLCVVQGGNHVLAPTVQGTTVARESFKLINRSRMSRGQAPLPVGDPSAPTAPTAPGNGLQ